MIDMVFLGTGSGVPSRRRNHSAIWLQYEADSMLWDCGEGTQRQLLQANINFMKIRHIFITHWHADHWAGLMSLIQTMNLEKKRDALHIHGPEAERFVSDILDLGYWGPRFKILANDVPSEGSSIHRVHRGEKYEILSIPVRHSVPSVAYCFKEDDAWNVDLSKAKKYGLGQGPLIGKLKRDGRLAYKGREIMLEDVGKIKNGLKVVYSGDTMYTENLVKLSQGADILIHDATFMDDQKNKMHTHAGSAARVARKAGVRQLILTHFSRRYTDVKPLRAEAEKIFGNTITAEDFMRIRLKR